MTNPIEQEPIWKPCKGCRELWTEQSFNDFGYCPDCHDMKFKGGLSKNRLWQKTIHDYWTAHPECICQAPQEMPDGIRATLYSLSKFEYVPAAKPKTMRDEVNE